MPTVLGHPCASTPRPTRRRWRSVVLLAASTLVATAAASTAVVPARATAAVSQGTVVGQSADLPTPVRISSFNLLGYGHTAPGGDRKGWASGTVRMHWAVDLIHQYGLQIIGFQEMQQPQWETFHQLAGGEFGLYPGNKLTTAAMANSIAWRRDAWELVEARTMEVPYFDGHLIRMPYVKLRNRTTGREIWVYNSHNPADAHGPAQQWRDAAVRLEVGLVNRLHEETPGIPVFITGDKNDHEQYFCPITGGTDMHASNGGSDDGTCSPPARMRVDWVMGSAEVTFTGYQDLRTPLVVKTTDHPVIVADAVLPSPAVVSAGVRRVVVVSVSGLRSQTIARLGVQGTPNLHQLMDAGASTLDARPAHERAGWLANTVSMVTGDRVNPDEGGHGVGTDTDPGTTVQAAAGHYVSSMFDVVHNYGGRTALVSADPGFARIDQSWNERSGAVPVYGPDTERDKITEYVAADDDADVVATLQNMIASRPGALTVASLTGVRAAGMRYGWRSNQYFSAVTAADRLVGRLARSIREDAGTAEDTMLVVTSERGGAKRGSDSRSTPSFYRLPLIVSGPGVAAGADLYDLNPQFADPGERNPGYGEARQPIRVAYIANLVTKVLKLPQVPGSGLDGAQTLTVAGS